jgi:hypothetical protein
VSAAWIRRLLSSRRGKVAVAVLIALGVAAGAAAYFTSTGSGSGSANVGTTQAVTITAGSPTSSLYPGGSADVRATISNPNSVQVRITSLALDTGEGTSGYSANASGCALSFTTQINGGSGWTVPPKFGSLNGTLDVDLIDAISMGAGAANSCQGQTFTVYLKVGP